MENKMYAKKAFKCSICDKEYEDAMDRARCELACGKKQQEEAKKAAEAKKQAEQLARKTKVDEAYDRADELYDEAHKLRDEYVKDYGVYTRIDKTITNAATCRDWLGLDEIFKLFH